MIGNAFTGPFDGLQCRVSGSGLAPCVAPSDCSVSLNHAVLRPHVGDDFRIDYTRVSRIDSNSERQRARGKT